MSAIIIERQAKAAMLHIRITCYTALEYNICTTLDTFRLAPLACHSSGYHGTGEESFEDQCCIRLPSLGIKACFIPAHYLSPQGIAIRQHLLGHIDGFRAQGIQVWRGSS